MTHTPGWLEHWAGRETKVDSGSGSASGAFKPGDEIQNKAGANPDFFGSVENNPSLEIDERKSRESDDERGEPENFLEDEVD